MRTPGRRGTGWKSAAIACLGLLLGNLAQAVPVSDCTEDALTAALTEGGVVNFTTDCALSITAPIVINRDVSLTGTGFKVTLVSTNSRIFEVASGVTVTLDNITIASSRATNGGALYIQPGANATLTGCSFVGNLAVGADGVAGISAPTNTLPNSGSSGGNATPGHPALGGAILNMGTLSCSNCIFLNNRAYGGLGAAGGNGENGIYQGGNGGNASSGAVAQGGAIYNLGQLWVDSCTFSSNAVSAGSGGLGGAAGGGTFGAWTGRGGDGAAAAGAAIWSSNQISIVNCAFTYNLSFGGDSKTAGTTGGGTGAEGAKGGDAFGAGLATYRSAGVTNSTFFGNYSHGGNGGTGGTGSYTGGKGGNGGTGSGGAICNFGTLTVMSCTSSGNGSLGGTNGAGGSGAFSGASGSFGSSLGANLANASGSILLKNSILGPTMIGPAGYGTITDAGHNICADASISLTSATSYKSTDPKLADPADNGGSGLTVTMLPLPGSAAANHGELAGTLSRDQRGQPRPGTGKTSPDIGAFEGSAPVITSEPLDQYKATNSSVTLSVVASGQSPLLYRWAFNTTNLPPASATNASLVISTLTASQFGPYFVVVSNTFGSVTSRVATIRPRQLIATSISPAPAGTNQSSISFAFPSALGLNYRVEYKRLLTDTNWTQFSIFSGSGYRLTNQVPIGSNRTGFYRVVTY